MQAGVEVEVGDPAKGVTLGVGEAVRVAVPVGVTVGLSVGEPA